MIRPALLRLQARRLPTGVRFGVFETLDSAAEWPDWPARDVEQPRLACERPPAAWP